MKLRLEVVTVRNLDFTMIWAPYRRTLRTIRVPRAVVYMCVTYLLLLVYMNLDSRENTCMRHVIQSNPIKKLGVLLTAVLKSERVDLCVEAPITHTPTQLGTESILDEFALAGTKGEAEHILTIKDVVPDTRVDVYTYEGRRLSAEINRENPSTHRLSAESELNKIVGAPLSTHALKLDARSRIDNATIYDSFKYYTASVEPNVRLLDKRSTTLLIGVFTTADKTDAIRRNNIRNTYARLLPSDLRLVFVMCRWWGSSSSYDLVYDELQLYKDIFFLEGLENMDGGKTYSWFKSVYHQLHMEGGSIKYIMKVDTDTFLYINTLLPWISKTVKDPIARPAIFGRQHNWNLDQWFHSPDPPEGVTDGIYMGGGAYGVSYASLQFIATSQIVANMTKGYEDKMTGLWLELLGTRCTWHALPEDKSFVDQAWIPNTHKYRESLTNYTKIVHALKTQTIWDGVAQAISDFLLGRKQEDCTYMGMKLVEGQEKCEPTSDEEYYKEVDKNNPNGLGYQYTDPDTLRKANPWLK